MKTTKWSDDPVQISTFPVLMDKTITRIWGKKHIDVGRWTLKVRTLFRAPEPQAPVTRQEMDFGVWLGAWSDSLSAPVTDEEFSHWRRFHETRIYGPTVEWVDTVVSP